MLKAVFAGRVAAAAVAVLSAQQTPVSDTVVNPLAGDPAAASD